MRRDPAGEIAVGNVSIILTVSRTRAIRRCNFLSFPATREHALILEISLNSAHVALAFERSGVRFSASATDGTQRDSNVRHFRVFPYLITHEFLKIRSPFRTFHATSGDYGGGIARRIGWIVWRHKRGESIDISGKIVLIANP